MEGTPKRGGGRGAIGREELYLERKVNLVRKKDHYFSLYERLLMGEKKGKTPRGGRLEKALRRRNSLRARTISFRGYESTPKSRKNELEKNRLASYDQIYSAQGQFANIIGAKEKRLMKEKKNSCKVYGEKTSEES